MPVNDVAHFPRVQDKMEAKAEEESGGTTEADSTPFILDTFKRVKRKLSKR